MKREWIGGTLDCGLSMSMCLRSCILSPMGPSLGRLRLCEQGWRDSSRGSSSGYIVSHFRSHGQTPFSPTQVLEQFLEHAVDSREELIEAYLLGSRLVHFLDRILPTHPAYNDATRAERRRQSQQQLQDLNKYLEQVAQLLDREEYALYVQTVLDGKGRRSTPRREDKERLPNKEPLQMERKQHDADADAAAPMNISSSQDISSMEATSSQSKVTPSKAMISFTSLDSDSSKLPLLLTPVAQKQGEHHTSQELYAYDTATILPATDDQGSAKQHSRYPNFNTEKNESHDTLSAQGQYEDDSVFRESTSSRLGIETLEYKELIGEQGFEHILEPRVEPVVDPRLTPAEVSDDDEEDKKKPRASSALRSSPPTGINVLAAIQKFERQCSGTSTKPNAAVPKPQLADKSRAKEILEQVREHRMQRQMHKGSIVTRIQPIEPSIESSGRVTPTELGERANHYPVRYGNWQRPKSPKRYSAQRWEERRPESVASVATMPQATTLVIADRGRDQSKHLNGNEAMEGRRHDGLVERCNNELNSSTSAAPGNQRALSSPSVVSNEHHFNRLRAPSFETFDSFVVSESMFEPRLGAEPRNSPWNNDLFDRPSELPKQAPFQPVDDHKENVFVTPEKPKVHEATSETGEGETWLKQTEEEPHPPSNIDDGSFAERLGGWSQQRVPLEAVGDHRVVTVDVEGNAEVAYTPSTSHASQQPIQQLISPPSTRSEKASSPTMDAIAARSSTVSLEELAATFPTDFAPFPQVTSFEKTDKHLEKTQPESQSAPAPSQCEWIASWPEIASSASDPPLQVDTSTSTSNSEYAVDKPIIIKKRNFRSDSAQSKMPQDCGSSEWRRTTSSVGKEDDYTLGRFPSADDPEQVFSPFRNARMDFDDDSISDPDILASKRLIEQKVEAMRQQQETVMKQGRLLSLTRQFLERPPSASAKHVSRRESSPNSSAPFDSTLNTCHLPDRAFDLKPASIEKRFNAVSKVEASKNIVPQSSPNNVGQFEDDSFWKGTGPMSPKRTYDYKAMDNNDQSVSDVDDDYDLIHGYEQESSQSLMTRGQRRLSLLKSCVAFLRD